MITWINNIFPNCFSFYLVNHSDASLKNNMAVAVAHIYKNSNIQKIKHYAINIITTNAKLFAIRCRINRALNCDNVSHIIIVTDAIHATEKITNTSHYLS